MSGQSFPNIPLRASYKKQPQNEPIEERKKSDENDNEEDVHMKGSEAADEV